MLKEHYHGGGRVTREELAWFSRLSMGYTRNIQWLVEGMEPVPLPKAIAAGRDFEGQRFH